MARTAQKPLKKLDEPKSITDIHAIFASIECLERYSKANKKKNTLEMLTSLKYELLQKVLPDLE